MDKKENENEEDEILIKDNKPKNFDEDEDYDDVSDDEVEEIDDDDINDETDDEVDSDIDSIGDISESDNDDYIDNYNDTNIVNDNDLIKDIDALKTKSIPFLKNSKMNDKKKITLKQTIIITDKNKFITSNLLTKYELCRVISERANALEHGAQPLVDITHLNSKQDIALKELSEKKCPIFIYRPIPHHKDIVYEKWDVNDLLYIK